MWSQESGQLLIDKSRAWRELLLAAFLNQKADFYYSMVNGDKDTFLFSWLATGQPFYFVPFPPFPAGVVGQDGQFCGNSFIQSDSVGRPLFIHAVNAKSMPQSTLLRKWVAAKPFDERASPYYRWQGACIDVDSNGEPTSTSIVPFASLCGNIEDALNFFHRKAG
jgi:hypothetical protein